MFTHYENKQYPLRDGRWASRVHLKRWENGALVVAPAEPVGLDVGIFDTEAEAIAFNATLAAVAGAGA